MTSARLIVFVFLCVLCGACTSPQTKQAATSDYLQQQKAAARTLYDEGKLAQSLAMWRSLLPLGPADEETASAIKSVAAEIQNKVNANLRAAKKYYAKGQARQGDTYMLRVLALSPGNAQALQQLGKRNSEQVRKQQENKTDEEYRVAAERKRNAPGSNYQKLLALYERKDYAGMVALPITAETAEPEVAGLLRSAHLQLSDQAEQSGDLDAALVHLQSAIAIEHRDGDPLVERELALRRDLGLYWYQQGTLLLKTDLTRAVAALQKSLAYNPSDYNTKRKLAQAQTMQRNLQKIEDRR